MVAISQGPRRRLGRAVLVLAVTGSLGLTACGSSGSTASLDSEKIERAIERSGFAQRGLRARVSCPADVEYAKGTSFQCVAVVGEVRTRFIVTQTDAAGHVRYEAR